MKKYEVSAHAEKRAVERLKQPPHNAKNHLIQLMQSAVYNGAVQSHRGLTRVFDHYATRTRLIVAYDRDVIITTYSMDSVKGGAVPTQALATAGILSDVIRATVERELRKAQRTFKRSYRQYTLRLADLNVEIAELFRNKVRCKHPGTQTIIQMQIDALRDEAKAVQDAIAAQESEYRAVESEAKGFISVEATI